MRNSTFNQLLVVLILFDNTFIIFAMLDYACVRGWESKGNTFILICPVIFSVFLANIDRKQSVCSYVSKDVVSSK